MIKILSLPNKRDIMLLIFLFNSVFHALFIKLFFIEENLLLNKFNTGI